MERGTEMPTKSKKSSNRKASKLSRGKAIQEVKPLLNPQPLPPLQMPKYKF
jgi:hypothetical protein